LSQYNIDRLAARIHELRERGMRISMEKLYETDEKTGKRKYVNTEYRWEDFGK